MQIIQTLTNEEIRYGNEADMLETGNTDRDKEEQEAGSEEIRIDVFYLYMEPQPGIPVYVADQITDPDSFYGADAVKYAMDELFTHCHLFRINNEVPTCYEYVSSDAKGAVFYKFVNRAAFENMDPNKKRKKVRFKWSDIESVIPV